MIDSKKMINSNGSQASSSHLKRKTSTHKTAAKKTAAKTFTEGRVNGMQAITPIPSKPKPQPKK